MLFGECPFKGLNILNDIESKCSEGFDLLMEINPQLIKKRNKSIGEKDLNTLRHFFAKIFVVNPTKRMTIIDISKHPIFKDSLLNLEENSSTESSESIEEQRLFNIRKVEFMENVEVAINSKSILESENQLLMKYFFNKVALCVLTATLKEIDFNEDKVYKDVYAKKIEKVSLLYKKVKDELEKLISSKVQFGINVTTTHLSSPYEKFEYFKDIYRVFLGYVFSQVHSSTMKEKERLKIKVLCCHTINRVFEDSSAKYFQTFNLWASKRSSKMSKGSFDF
jgi:serine/threonine protein kinase